MHGNLYVAASFSALPSQQATDRLLQYNSLTGPLPFEDGYFDHVRAMSIAVGVPEPKVCGASLSPMKLTTDFYVFNCAFN